MKTLRINPRQSAVVLAALAAATLSACASDSGPNTALIEAQQSYATAAADPAVTQNAPLELRRAEELLRQAEALQAGSGSEREISHQAYLASQQTRVAVETAEAKQARESVQGAELARGNAMLQARNAQLEQQLRDLQAQKTDRGLVLTLGDVLFATGSAALTPGAEVRLDRLAEFLKAHPERTARIEGYTDSTGSSDFNLRLSEQRAEAVRDALTARGVGSSRLTAHGYGAAQPVASNAEQAGRQANRRVEVVISDDGTVATSQ